MGAVAEVLGIHASFYVTGLILLAMMLYVALRARSVLGPGSGT